MAGIAGIVSPLPGSLALQLGELTRPLLFQATSRAETWHNSRVAVCRVATSGDTSAAQPIFTEDGAKCIVFFGECFDYEAEKADLVRRGQTFVHPDSDAEFCLRLYQQHGDSAFASLDGSFCLAIVDLRQGELVLASDRLGTRPLFHGRTPDGSLVFATQVSSVLSVPGIDRRLDTSAVLEFCCLQRVVGTKTYHRGVQALPPASVLRFQDGRTVTAPYWHFSYRPQPGSADDYAEELARAMRRMARRLTRGGTPVAVLLSGGLDARMVVAAAETQLECYTFGDYVNPEATAARAVAEARGFPFHFLPRDPDHYAALVDRAVEMGSGMHSFNHAHAVGFMECIAAECVVVTHGFVPELLFRGSSLPKVARRMFGVEVDEMLDPTLSEGNLPQRMFKRGYSLLDTPMTGLFNATVRENLDETLMVSAKQMIDVARQASGSVYDQFLWPDVYYHGRYPSMLFELSLRHFLTERSIVFGNDVIDLHLRMPVAMRSDNRVWIKSLSMLNRKVAKVVNANTGHSSTLPVVLQSAIERGRALVERTPLAWRLTQHARGEATPEGMSPISWPRFDRMIRQNAKLRQIVVDTLSDDEALPGAIFDRDRIQAVLSDHLAERGHYRTILFALLTFGRWHKKHGVR